MSLAEDSFFLRKMSLIEKWMGECLHCRKCSTGSTRLLSGHSTGVVHCHDSKVDKWWEPTTTKLLMLTMLIMKYRVMHEKYCSVLYMTAVRFSAFIQVRWTVEWYFCILLLTLIVECLPCKLTNALIAGKSCRFWNYTILLSICYKVVVTGGGD